IPIRNRAKRCIRETLMRVLATHHVAIYTPNFETLEAFYTQTLGFPVTLRWDDATIIFIDVGSTQIELIGREATAGAPGPHAPFGGRVLK
ncbi:MAG: VOC family protein, partial [Chloroflexota bacterium]|nr:VOC family protein [Chloroflexota bacterium]